MSDLDFIIENKKKNVPHHLTRYLHGIQRGKKKLGFSGEISGLEIDEREDFDIPTTGFESPLEEFKKAKLKIASEIYRGVVRPLLLKEKSSHVFSDIEVENSFSHVEDSGDNPFSHFEDSRDNKEKIQDLISHIWHWLKVPYRERLANRVESLFNDSLDEEPEGLGISAESLKHFVSFLQFYPELKYPSIVITPNWNILAQWRESKKQYFSVEVTPDGKGRFVIFRSNPKHPDQIDRFSGITTMDGLFELMKKNSVLYWASNA